MSIVRSSRPSGNFTIIQNEIFKSAHLSFAGMGFLCFLLSKPENWSISIPACAKVTQGSRRASGRDAIYALLDELIAAGYIDRQDVRDGSGRRSGVRYVVYDAPIGSKEKPYYGPREKDAPEQVEQETAAPIPAEPFLANTDALIRTDIKQGLKENKTNNTTNTHAQAQETKSEVKPEPAATDGWLTFGHEVMAAAGVDYTRSMMQAGCVRQWLADAAKAGYTRQQAEAVILDVVRERAKYGGQGKPPAWFSRPVADAIANGSVGASQEAQECGQAEWEGEWRTDYLRHVQSRSNGAGKVMSRDAFRAEWMKERGIE